MGSVRKLLVLVSKICFLVVIHTPSKGSMFTDACPVPVFGLGFRGSLF